MFSLRKVNQMQHGLCGYFECVLNIPPQEPEEFMAMLCRDFGTGATPLHSTTASPSAHEIPYLSPASFTCGPTSLGTEGKVIGTPGQVYTTRCRTAGHSSGASSRPSHLRSSPLPAAPLAHPTRKSLSNPPRECSGMRPSRRGIRGRIRSTSSSKTTEKVG